MSGTGMSGAAELKEPMIREFPLVVFRGQKQRPQPAQRWPSALCIDLRSLQSSEAVSQNMDVLHSEPKVPQARSPHHNLKFEPHMRASKTDSVIVSRKHGESCQKPWLY